ncbi:MAG: Fic family protein [Clostridiales bacterium]|nr:Fic family protein [Clostridiales bacterium]
MTDEILNLVTLISVRVDLLTIQNLGKPGPKLRRNNRIKSIHSSLAIENNSLSLDQVTAILEGKRVLAPPQDICEAENAFKAYERLFDLNPYDPMDLLAAHGLLMNKLLKEPGEYRQGNVGVARGEELVHIAPPAENVSGLMADLLYWVEHAQVHPLIKSCVFHYEFEIIHPFPDGNGRMGRMWQTLLLSRWKEIFAWLPVETMVYERQAEYYAALDESNNASDCTVFIEFILKSIWETLEKFSESDQDSDQVSDQVKKLLEALGDRVLSAKELMDLLGLKHRPSFRKNYLNPALEEGLVEMTIPERPNSRNQRYKKAGGFL